MSNQLKVLICGRHLDVNFWIPTTFSIVRDFNLIDYEISLYPLSRWIILFCDKLDPSSDAVLTRVNHIGNVVVTLICDNSINHLSTNQTNRLRIAEHLITYRTLIDTIRAYRLIVNELDALGKKDLAKYFVNQEEFLSNCLLKNLLLQACHVLLIPLNTTNPQNYLNCQLDIMDYFKNLWPDKEIRVCNIYEYLSAEESNISAENLSEGTSSLFKSNTRDMICALIQKLAPIRIYLIGNERSVTNDWSRLLVAKERNINENSARKYIDGCTFIEYEVVNERIKYDVPAYLGTTYTWQIDRTKTIPSTVADLTNDDFFKTAVESIDDTLLSRENIVKHRLAQGNYQKTTSDCSDYLHSIGEAQTSRVDQDEDSRGIIDTSIQRSYRKSPENR